MQKPNFRPHSYLRDATVGVKATDCSNIIARKGNGTGQHRPYSPELITLEQLVQITVQGLGQHACLLCPSYIVHQLLAFKWSATAVTAVEELSSFGSHIICEQITEAGSSTWVAESKDHASKNCA